MNGEVIPIDHGYPVRAVAPGLKRFFVFSYTKG
jgi:DMSO/TMAO reductase YedYZ molybdopterin-dependent catalytic subunit